MAKTDNAVLEAIRLDGFITAKQIASQIQESLIFLFLYKENRKIIMITEELYA